MTQTFLHMTPTQDFRVLIVGAGPTGLSAAVELARLGVIADVVERRSEPSALSRAVGILPETIAKLDHGGIGEAIRKEAMSYRKIKTPKLSFALSTHSHQSCTRLPARSRRRS